MPTLPRDATDLYLAPVALAVDGRIEELGLFDVTELRERVALDAGGDWTPEMRASALLQTVGYLLDLHDWELSWHERGIRVSHDERSFVLGVPPVFREYLAGPAAE